MYSGKKHSALVNMLNVFKACSKCTFAIGNVPSLDCKVLLNDTAVRSVISLSQYYRHVKRAIIQQG